MKDENKLLRNEVYQLESQLNKSRIRIAELVEENNRLKRNSNLLQLKDI